MTRYGFLPVWIDSAASGLPVRRITQYQVKTFRSEAAGSIPEIHLAYFDPGGQCIFLDVSPGKSSEFSLDLDPENFVFRLPSMGKHQGNHSTAGSQFDNAIDGSDAGQAREEDGVHGKAVTFLFLEDRQVSIEKSVAGEIACSVYQAISSQGERGFITRPLVTLG